MLELQMLVLQKISADKKMFRKELIKSMKWLNAQEIAKLEIWVKENFWETHKDEINEAFYLYEEYIKTNSELTVM